MEPGGVPQGPPGSLFITMAKKKTDGLPSDEQLKVIGEMARVVSHEVRNPLAAMRNSAYFVKMQVQKMKDPNEKVVKHCGIIETEIAKADEVLSWVLSYARMPQPTKSALGLHSLLNDVLSQDRVPHFLDAHKNFAKDDIVLQGDRDLLTRAFGALAQNAADAVEHDGKGKLLVTTKKKGKGAEITFEDNGTGLSAEAAQRAFEPFFTTKPKNVGLGLPYALMAVTRHGGTVSISGSPQGGCTVIVTL